mmetsp:Transcript_51750/g.161056  ORF Transcript_51750/g.161056 Transcript_51750/m.161056 type:complete len:122 (-) Transcript_51750:901-1266(-)
MSVSDSKGREGVAGPRSSWVSGVTNLDVDVFVMGEEESPHLDMRKVISMARTSLQERIASIAARKEEGADAHAAERRLEQELDSVPSLRSLLAMLPPEPNVLVDEWTRVGDGAENGSRELT